MVTLAPFVESIRLTVDGGNPVDLQTRRNQIFSPQRHVELLADNFLGVPPGPATFTAWGWVAWLKDLAPGVHTLRSEAVFDDGSNHIWELLVHVVSDGHGESRRLTNPQQTDLGYSRP